MKRKLITLFLFILTVITVASAFTVTANAATASLTVNDKWVYSNTLSAKGTKATVYNAASSNHDVYGIIQYKSGTSYVTDYEFLVKKGVNSGYKNSASKFTANKTWRLELNPYGVATKGCTADGTIVSR